jgi:hypothetical protein
VPRDDLTPRAAGRVHRGRQREHRWVPDVFGVQLLGPQHLANLALPPRWTVAAAGDMAVVSDDDLDAWYGAASRPDLERVASARRDFSAVLLRAGHIE